jgi:hypothetical protein
MVDSAARVRQTAAGVAESTIQDRAGVLGAHRVALAPRAAARLGEASSTGIAAL